MIKTYDFYKKNMPGFEKSFIVLTGPQLGTRSSRRMIGEYQLTKKTWPITSRSKILSPSSRTSTAGRNRWTIPICTFLTAALLPKNVDNILVACRAFSSDMHVQDYFNLIPHCIAFGEAAGTASAMALKAGVGIKNVDIKALQKQLAKQGVPLPDVKKKVDHKYTGPALVSTPFTPPALNVRIT